MKNIFKTFVLALTVSTALLSSSCDYKKTALGEHEIIYVFADSLLWLDVKDSVLATFDDYIYTPRAERSFILEWLPLSQLNGVKGRMNLMFIGTTKAGNDVNDFLLKSVPAEFIQSVNNDRNFYFFKDDLYLANQISIFMIARDVDSFKRNFDNTKENIYRQFQKKYYARLEKSMFDRGEQTDLEDFLVENYSYKVRVQHDYFLANQSLEEKYVWLRRLDPDRWISIWHLNADSSALTIDSLENIRNVMTAKYYGGDVVVTDETHLDTVLFRGQETVKLTGTWRND